MEDLASVLADQGQDLRVGDARGDLVGPPAGEDLDLHIRVGDLKDPIDDPDLDERSAEGQSALGAGTSLKQKPPSATAKSPALLEQLECLAAPHEPSVFEGSLGGSGREAVLMQGPASSRISKRAL